MMILFSIIVPAFNEEKNIEACLDSLICQDIPADKYEVILVNDGSTDSTLSIMLSYADRNKNFIVVDQPNKNLGGARNTGLLRASGKYVIFLDSDDALVKNTLSKLCSLISLGESDVDVYMCDFYRKESFGLKLIANGAYSHNENRLCSGREFLKCNQIYWVVWHCLFRRDFLLDEQIFFREGVFFEDVDFSLKTVFLARKIKYSPTYFYIHNFNVNSITNSARTYKKLDDQLTAARVLLDFVGSIKSIDIDAFNVFAEHVYLKYIEALKTAVCLDFSRVLFSSVIIFRDRVSVVLPKSRIFSTRAAFLLLEKSPIVFSFFIFSLAKILTLRRKIWGLFQRREYI